MFSIFSQMFVECLGILENFIPKLFRFVLNTNTVYKDIICLRKF